MDRFLSDPFFYNRIILQIKSCFFNSLDLVVILFNNPQNYRLYKSTCSHKKCTCSRRKSTCSHKKCTCSRRKSTCIDTSKQNCDTSTKNCDTSEQNCNISTKNEVATSLNYGTTRLNSKTVALNESALNISFCDHGKNQCYETDCEQHSINQGLIHPRSNPLKSGNMELISH